MHIEHLAKPTILALLAVIRFKLGFDGRCISVLHRLARKAVTSCCGVMKD